jgi:hypothetical protein
MTSTLLASLLTVAIIFAVLYICERARRVDLRRRLDCIIRMDDEAFARRDATIKQLQNDLREARSIKSSAPARDRHPATTHAGSGNY